ncbi:MAG: hypothetical protein CTY32_08525 [Methylotenera sp.]|nr:MAG: hypothetical protein CTY32_08525 [Methylotenera sp.]
MLITVQDKSTYRITHREYTDEGFLRVPGRVARTGIQEYLRSDLALDGNPNEIVKVYRPPEEVFHPDSLASYDASDITLNHPSGLVTSEIYRSVVSGVVRGKGVQDEKDNNFVKCDLIVKDKASIDAVNSGKCELSAGYTAEYIHSPGVTADGESYDYVQRDIRINHVAIVERARAGAQARIFDHNHKGITMSKIVLDSGKTVEVQDEATALLVTDTIERLTKKVKDAEAVAEAEKAKADKKEEELEEAKKASSDEAIKVRVSAIADCQATARKIAGDEFTCDSVDMLAIQRAALKVKRPAVDWDSKTAVYVQASFDMAAEEPKATTDSTIVDQLKQVAKDGADPVKTAVKVSAYDAYKASIANAHKGEK